MYPIAKINQPTLTWEQPKWSRDYFELLTGKAVVASLAMTRWFSDEAEARTAGSSWIFDRLGFFRTHGVALQKGSEIEVARFDYDWTKDCTIYLKDGRTYEWFRTKTFQEAYALTAEDDSLIYAMELGTHWFKRQARLELGVLPADLADLDLLLCLGFYLGYCAQQDTAAAVAATTGAS